MIHDEPNMQIRPVIALRKPLVDFKRIAYARTAWSIESWGHTRQLLLISLLAFIARFVVRYHSGSVDFWENGYEFYFALAQNIAAKKDISFAVGRGLYPVFL